MVMMMMLPLYSYIIVCAARSVCLGVAFVVVGRWVVSDERLFPLAMYVRARTWFGDVSAQHGAAVHSAVQELHYFHVHIFFLLVLFSVLVSIFFLLFILYCARVAGVIAIHTGGFSKMDIQ